jgi:hypothetical protein
MAERAGARAVTLLLAALSLAAPALAAERGDLGRAPVDEWAGDRISREDWGIFPRRGRLAIAAAEIEMHARLARFFDPDTRRGWIARFRQAAYADAATRYRVLEDEVEADLVLLPAAFDSVCAVLALDSQRHAALSELGAGDKAMASALARRVAENSGTVTGFATELNHRADSYGETLDRLLVETPDRAAAGVDDRLWALQEWAEAAARGDFCAAPVAASVPQAPVKALPGRVLGGGQPAARK